MTLSNQDKSKKELKKYYRIGPGQPPSYTPEELAKKAEEYFEWCIDTPLQAEEIVKYRDSHTKDSSSKMRVMSVLGFCIFAKITRKTFYNYHEKKKYLHITTRIKEITEQQMFEGAASGFLNPNIIARKLGLSDKQEIKASITDDLSKLTTDELLERAKAVKEIEQNKD